jgi:MAP3K TRAFs-binding domain
VPTIIHSTVIDKPMYENLLDADVVVADLSTSNANAIYELGVRHALKPTTTIVIAENNFSFPFDLNHLSILKYEHLGKEIGYGEVLRVKEALKQKLVELVERREVDSPVYLFLPSLTRAERAAALAMAARAPSSAPMDDKSFADLMDSFRRAKAAVKRSSDWIKPIAFLERLRTMQPQDPYVLQQLALATYKSELPDKLTALRDAKSILAPLAPTTSADAETVGLWGAVHKRLWEEGHDPADLDQGISAYERGFFLKNDYYNGINYAFMLDVRASLSAGDDAVADRVLARRVRTRVLDICEEKTKAGNVLGDDPFWVGATKVEALFGLGRKQEAETLKRSVVTEERQRLQAAGGNANEADWKEKTLNEQLVKLDKLLPNAPR